MHIVLGNQRRVAFLSAALKGKVGPIRATAHWLLQTIGSIGLVRHGKTLGSGGFTAPSHRKLKLRHGRHATCSTSP